MEVMEFRKFSAIKFAALLFYNNSVVCVLHCLRTAAIKQLNNKKNIINLF